MWWQQTFDLRFVLVFGSFEEYLRRLSDDSVCDFHEQFVVALNAPGLRINVVISIDESADSLLAPMRAQVPGFGDASLRLPAAMKQRSTDDHTSVGGASPTHGLIGSQRPATASNAAAHNAAILGGAASPVIHDVARPHGSVGSAARSAVEQRLIPSSAQDSATECEMAEQRFGVPSTSVPAPGSGPGPVVKRASRLRRSRWLVPGALLLGFALFWALVHPEPAKETRHEPQPVSEPPMNVLKQPPGAPTDGAPIQAADGASNLPLPAPTSDSTAAAFAGGAQAQLPPPSAAATNIAEEAIAEGTAIVYIHVRSEAQRARAKTFVPVLARRGIRVSGIKLVPDGPSAPDLRYFRNHEAREAAHVARTLRDAGIASPRVKRIGGYENSARPRQYELWFAPGDLRAGH